MDVSPPLLASHAAAAGPARRLSVSNRLEAPFLMAVHKETTRAKLTGETEEPDKPCFEALLHKIASESVKSRAPSVELLCFHPFGRAQSEDVCEESLQAILSHATSLESLKLKNITGVDKICLKSKSLTRLYGDFGDLKELIVEDDPNLEELVGIGLPSGKAKKKEEEEEAAAARMPRDGVAQGLEVEAVLAAEASWEQRDAAASMVGSLDMDLDSPQLLSKQGADGSISAPDSSALNKVAFYPFFYRCSHSAPLVL
ncbi:F-box/LRR-repeat protein [Panicum miliaceum]|uniref:F-box/LRR-repeat protein n=1 Tax=Panicum miliaceum TaxID=4540 RepID=A0A3L6RFN9_PANMI|nr:F-box/LRR-repeat protein [Panicum miliaceum]